jgi:hypothetical protein
MIYEQGGLTNYKIPPAMPKAFTLEGRVGGEWIPLATVTDNRSRHVRIPVNRELDGIRFTLVETRGAPESRVYAFTVS